MPLTHTVSVGTFLLAVLAMEHDQSRPVAAAIARSAADTEPLRQLYPEIYRRFNEAAWQADALYVREPRTWPGMETVDNSRGRARAAMTEYNAAIEAVRQIPGYQDFLRPLTLSAIQTIISRSLENSALVYIAPTELGTLALIVSPRRVSAVWCPLISKEMVNLLNGGSDEDFIKRGAGLVNPRSTPELLLVDVPRVLDSLDQRLYGSARRPPSLSWNQACLSCDMWPSIPPPVARVTISLLSVFTRED